MSGLGTHPLVMLPGWLHQMAPFHPCVDGGMAASLTTVQPLTPISALSPITVPVLTVLNRGFAATDLPRSFGDHSRTQI
jgi:hypothetical protein